MPDGNVDADRLAVLRLLRLVDDGIKRDNGLANAAVADHEFALAAADRNHRVDCLDARVNRRVHRLALQDRRGFRLERVALRFDALLVLDDVRRAGCQAGR